MERNEAWSIPYWLRFTVPIIRLCRNIVGIEEINTHCMMIHTIDILVKRLAVVMQPIEVTLSHVNVQQVRVSKQIHHLLSGT